MANRRTLRMFQNLNMTLRIENGILREEQENQVNLTECSLLIMNSFRGSTQNYNMRI